jgi:hypothetical protein
MDIDFATLTEYQRYKLMASLIVPRPIALVTTLGEDGTVNAAPFSMFNMMGEEPPIVMISVNRMKDGAQKDTAANIQRDREFVVHLADEAMAAQMHGCGERVPPDVSEVDLVGLTTAPERLVQVRRNRLTSMGEDRDSNYVELDAVRAEIAATRQLFENQEWPMIDVSRRSIEETAAAVMNLLADRKEKAR